MLRLDRLSNPIDDPYPHVMLHDCVKELETLNAEFPPKESFGPTIRMDADLTAGDPGYEQLILRSASYAALHQQVYSPEFIRAFLEVFRPSIRAACKAGQLIADPYTLKIIAEPVEKRVTGEFLSREETFLYPRLDLGYGGVGYGLKNGGRGIHIDNAPRLISILIFLNTPQSMVGGTHRLYGLLHDKPIISKVYHPVAGLLIASLQSNRAFHDVEPIARICGERRAIYMAVSCSKPIWKREANAALRALSKNRYDAPATDDGVMATLQRLRSFGQKVARRFWT
jgi:hypothetical protein